MAGGKRQIKDYLEKEKEDPTLTSPPDRVDFWMGVNWAADERRAAT